LLVLWLVVSLLMLPDLGFATVSEWLARPVPATAMALLIISTFWHARLGMQVAIEDYVHGANRVAALVAINLLAFGGAAFGLFCVIRLALGGA
jgi:succinate dehydrogenase / fumarate reductase membrane anchor subunit